MIELIPIRSVVVSGVALSKFDNEIKLLLMKRVKEGFWCHVTGKIKEHETAWQAIIREFTEETAIQVRNLFSTDFLEQFYEANLNVIEIIPAFVVICDEQQAVVLNHEHTEYRWCTFIEAKQLVSFSGQRKLYDHIWENFVQQQPSEYLKIAIHDQK